jgi:two-component system response regulator HydG
MTMSPAQARLLVVDDQQDTLELLQRSLAARGYQVFTASSVASATRFLEGSEVDLVITDFKMPGASGLDLVRHVRENLKNTEVMMITGYPTIEGAVKAVKTGAEEYLTKPFTQEELLSSVERALEKLQQRRAARRPMDGGDAFAQIGLLGESEAIRPVFAGIHKAAASPSPVLILGESGAGKELVARAFHFQSSRSLGPFLTFRAQGTPPSFQEAALLGPGSPTQEAIPGGLLAAAAGGTLYVEELSDLQPALQARLAKLMHEAVPPGSPFGVRLAASSRKDLGELVARGFLREDLYVRFLAHRIIVPPLRERGDDAILLFHHFAARHCREQDRVPVTLTQRARAILRSYPWPGNVQELENLVGRLLSSHEGEVVDSVDLPLFMRLAGQNETGAPRSLREIELEHIQHVLSLVNGNKTRAAQILGIDRKTLRQKLKDPR